MPEVCSMGCHPVSAGDLLHATPYCLQTEVTSEPSGCVRTTCPDIFCREEGRSTAPSWLGFNIGAVCGNKKRICQHPQEVGHQPWVMKVILTGVKEWKDASERASDKCRPYSKKQGGSGRRMRCYRFRRLHQALPTIGNRGVNERTPSRTRRQHTLEMQSPPLACTVRRDRKSQLSDAMRARLRPQTPDMEKPHVATTQEAYPSPSAAPVILDWPPHPPLQQIGWDMVSRGPPRLYQQAVGRHALHAFQL
ncbi:hypothetical protein CK203_054655 [Vitis vinifera]|uniref:Uncharacterized protein n=1 Tax=Vitis vinifera TaxID=29760 RepID=A0A438H949_VITVI|nr:hypothetical protein CK203_054655 [Vitis vinifera]